MTHGKLVIHYYLDNDETNLSFVIRPSKNAFTIPTPYKYALLAFEPRIVSHNIVLPIEVLHKLITTWLIITLKYLLI